MIKYAHLPEHRALIFSIPGTISNTDESDSTQSIDFRNETWSVPPPYNGLVSTSQSDSVDQASVRSSAIPSAPLARMSTRLSQISLKPPSYRETAPRATAPFSRILDKGKRALFDVPSGTDNILPNDNVALSASQASTSASTALTKRELHEKDVNFTDLEYRKGVHWAETLRLRRQSVMKSAFEVHSSLHI